MKPVDNIEKLIRDSHVLDVNTSAEMDQKIMHDALKVQEKLKETNLASTQPNIWRIILNSRISKLAAAAVIIVAVAFFAVHQGPDEQLETAGILEASKSPAEMLTLASINAAYRKGELEAVENRYERVLEMMEPWPSKISIQELFEDLNGS